MDYEKLIERLKAKDFERDYDCTPFECGVFGLLDDADTALSTLWAENKRLTSLLGESGQDLWNKENQRADRLEAENEKLRAELEQKSKLIAQQTAELERRDTLLKEQNTELERMKEITRENGIMVIPSKYPGGTARWNIQKPRDQKEK